MKKKYSKSNYNLTLHITPELKTFVGISSRDTWRYEGHWRGSALETEAAVKSMIFLLYYYITKNIIEMDTRYRTTKETKYYSLQGTMRQNADEMIALLKSKEGNLDELQDTVNALFEKGKDDVDTMIALDIVTGLLWDDYIRFISSMNMTLAESRISESTAEEYKIHKIYSDVFYSINRFVHLDEENEPSLGYRIAFCKYC